MSGQQFLDTLKQLGYPSADGLDPQMFNWMFENDSVAPFLTWFSQSVSKSNVLLPSQIKQYRELERSGEGVLEGEVLKDALHSLSASVDETQTIDSLRENVSLLEQEVEDCRNRKQLMMQRRERLNVHHTAKSERLTQLTGVESLAKRDHQGALEQLEGDNTEMSETLDSLVRSVTKINSLFHQPTAHEHESVSTHNPHFLSQVDLGDYYDMEDKFSHELKLFTKKRFFDGIAEMAGQGEVSKYELLEVSEPETLMVRGEKQDVVLQDSRELARLKAVYPISQSQLIEASVAHTQASAILAHTQKTIQRISSGDFPLDINKLRESLTESEAARVAVTRDLTQLQQSDLPTLISRSADLQGTNIITGDYKLKLARQGYFTSNQDQLIEELVVQRARNEFLTMAYEVEARNHRDIHRLLTAIRKTLQEHSQDWHNRQVAMEDPSLTPARHQRSTIDSRDKSTARLYHLLASGGGDDGSQLFLTYSGLVEGAARLSSKHSRAHSNLTLCMDKHEQKARMLEGEMRTCIGQLYHGASTTSGEPMLTPPLMQETAAQLETSLGKLEASIMDVIKEHAAKKKLLKSNPLQDKERDLFTYFHTQPGRLKQTVDTLIQRLQAQSVH